MLSQLFKVGEATYFFLIFLAPVLFPLLLADLQLRKPLTLSPDAFVKSLCSAATSASAVVGGTHLKLFFK